MPPPTLRSTIARVAAVSSPARSGCPLSPKELRQISEIRVVSVVKSTTYDAREIYCSYYDADNQLLVDTEIDETRNGGRVHFDGYVSDMHGIRFAGLGEDAAFDQGPTTRLAAVSGNRFVSVTVFGLSPAQHALTPVAQALLSFAIPAS
jgi:hypothetical protein